MKKMRMRMVQPHHGFCLVSEIEKRVVLYYSFFLLTTKNWSIFLLFCLVFPETNQNTPLFVSREQLKIHLYSQVVVNTRC